MAEIWSEKEDEAKVTSRVGGVNAGVMYLVNFVFESNE